MKETSKKASPEASEQLSKDVSATLLALIAIVLSALAALVFFVSNVLSNSPLFDVNDFDSCVKAGYPVQESHPRKCITPEGVSFTEVIKE